MLVSIGYVINNQTARGSPAVLKSETRVKKIQNACCVLGDFIKKILLMTKVNRADRKQKNEGRGKLVCVQRCRYS